MSSEWYEARAEAADEFIRERAHEMRHNDDNEEITDQILDGIYDDVIVEMIRGGHFDLEVAKRLDAIFTELMGVEK